MPWHAIIHWFNTEYWFPSWPNIFAPSVWTLLGIAYHHISIRNLHQKHHDELTGRAK